MHENRRKIRKGISVVFTFLIIFNVFFAVPLVSQGANVTKDSKSYDIAVVFDNSGSMYAGTDRWCQSKYAMEIFASMLDYGNGDKLTIFPMWEVTTDGNELNRDNQIADVEPVEIKSIADIDKITKLYTTTYDSGTPLAPIDEAADYLKTSKATDKWIVVLTDGAFNLDSRDTRVKVSATELKSKLVSLAKRGFNVQYLGFGDATELTSDESNRFYASDKKSSLQENLINICNKIFKRSELPKNYLNSKTLTLDISMKKIIVFVQGSDAKIGSLVNNDTGEAVNVLSNSGQRTYSTITGNGYKIGSNTKVDKNLAGQVVTFDACKAGSYTLEYSSADKIQIFYEPDVDMNVVLDGVEGAQYDPDSGTLASGSYKINAHLVDNVTGEDLTGHKLLGNVDLKVKVKTSEDDAYKSYANGAEIYFAPDSDTSIIIEGTYLEDYKITSEDDANLRWLSSVEINIPVADFSVKADVLQSDNWYVIKKHDQWQPIKVALTVNGVPLTEEEMERVNFVANLVQGNLEYKVEKSTSESAYYIYIAQNAEGAYVEPAVGTYTFSFAGTTYTDKYDKVYENTSEKASFDIQTYSKIWIKLIWVIIIGSILLAIAAIFLFIMTRKVLPGGVVAASISLETMSAGSLEGLMYGRVIYNKKRRTLKITTQNIGNEESCYAEFDIVPVDNRFTSSNLRKIKIVNIRSTNCISIGIKGTDYVKNSKGVWVKTTAPDIETAKPIDCEVANSVFELNRGTEVSNTSTLTCKIRRLSR